MTAHAIFWFIAGTSFYGWSLLLWSFHIWYTVKGNICYKTFAITFFALLQPKFRQSVRLFEIILLNCFSRVVIQLYLNALPNYTLSYYINELYSSLIDYRSIFSHCIMSQHYLQAQKLNADVMISRRRKYYPHGTLEKTSKNFSRKSLTVPIVSH